MLPSGFLVKAKGLGIPLFTGALSRGIDCDTDSLGSTREDCVPLGPLFVQRAPNCPVSWTPLTLYQ